MSRAHLVRALAMLGVALMFPAVAGAQGVRPRTLLVYYGWPTSINMTFSVPAAALEFGRYDHVVWGDGLDAAAHPDHANAVAIVAHPAAAATRFYGYVDLGVSTQNLPMAEVQARIARWDAVGVDGVLLDDFGYDFGTGRARQNDAVAYAHAQGLAVIANAFRPEDAFGAAPVPIHNPSGVATTLGPADFYFYESHGVRLGEYEDAIAWQAKANALEAYRASLGFKVLSITTTASDGIGGYDASRFFFAWHAALLYGHEATGWGEFGFSASGASNGQAPLRARPTLEPGSAFLGPVAHAGSYHTRQTDLGRIELDTADHSFGFSPGTVAVPTGDEPGPRALSAAPNPVRVGTSLVFSLAREQSVRIVLHDPNGRRLATLATGTFSAGRHQRAWSGRDDTSRRVAAGIYFATLEADDGRSAVRLVVLP